MTDKINPDSIFPVCPILDILRSRGLECKVENLICGTCDRRGVYKFKNKERVCNFYFNDYLNNYSQEVDQ